MASYLPSPFTTQVWGMSGYGLNRLPSIKRCCGCGFSCSIARCMGLAERLAGLVGLHTSVGDGALQGLADRQGRSLRGELQNGDGFGRLLAADEVDHAASLARRHADVTSDCFSFHVLFLILSDGPSCRPSHDP